MNIFLEIALGILLGISMPVYGVCSNSLNDTYKTDGDSQNKAPSCNQDILDDSSEDTVQELAQCACEDNKDNQISLKKKVDNILKDVKGNIRLRYYSLSKPGKEILIKDIFDQYGVRFCKKYAEDVEDIDFDDDLSPKKKTSYDNNPYNKKFFYKIIRDFFYNEAWIEIFRNEDRKEETLEEAIIHSDLDYFVRNYSVILYANLEFVPGSSMKLDISSNNSMHRMFVYEKLHNFYEMAYGRSFEEIASYNPSFISVFEQQFGREMTCGKCAALLDDLKWIDQLWRNDYDTKTQLFREILQTPTLEDVLECAKCVRYHKYNLSNSSDCFQFAIVFDRLWKDQNSNFRENIKYENQEYDLTEYIEYYDLDIAEARKSELGKKIIDDLGENSEKSFYLFLGIRGILLYSEYLSLNEEENQSESIASL